MLLTATGVQRLETGGMIVGLFAEASYDQDTVHLRTGDLLTVFSDGVSEALSAGGEEFGEHRVLEAVSAVEGGSTEASLQALLARSAVTHGAVQNDDVAAMLVNIWREATPTPTANLNNSR